MLGWPGRAKDINNAESKKFFNVRYELNILGGLLLKGSQVVIPRTLRKAISEKLHKSHQGVSYTLNFARRNVFWPGFSLCVKEVCEKCQACKKFSPDPPPLPMQYVEIPSYPGEIISIDTFNSNYGGERNQYLLIVDHFSDFFEINRLKDMTSRTTINLLKNYFGKFGVTSKMIADNARQLIGEDMRKFA